MLARSGSSAWRSATVAMLWILPYAATADDAWAQVAFQPAVSSFPDGVGLSVTPVVTADRRYVRMGIAPFFTGLQGFDTYSVPAAVGGTGGGFGGAGANGGQLFAGLNGLSPAGVGGVPTMGPQFGPNASMMPMASAGASAVLSGQLGPERPPTLSAAARTSPSSRASKRVTKRPTRPRSR